MSDITILRARLRKRDKDIQRAVRQLQLEEGEMADMVRDGFRLILSQKALSKPQEPLTPDAARLVARELMNNLAESSSSPSRHRSW